MSGVFVLSVVSAAGDVFEVGRQQVVATAVSVLLAVWLTSSDVDEDGDGKVLMPYARVTLFAKLSEGAHYCS